MRTALKVPTRNSRPNSLNLGPITGPVDATLQGWEATWVSGAQRDLVFHSARRGLVGMLEARIKPCHFADQEFGRHVVEGAVQHFVLHERAAGAVIGLQQRV